MKKTIGLLAILVLLFPCLGFSDSVSFRLGFFIPKAGDPNNHDSDLWTIEFDNMTYSNTNFRNAVLSFAYEHFLTRELSLVIGFDTYSKIERGDYRDYIGYGYTDIGDFGFPADIQPEGYDTQFAISHQLSVSILPIQASLKLTPFGRKSSFIPYFGGGVSMYIFSVKLRGDMIDFNNLDWVYNDVVQIYPVYTIDARAETRFAVGFQGFAGVMIPLASRMAVEAEFKYTYGKGNLGKNFEDFAKFDLSAYQVSLGINYWF
jgi:opacity protein-like surface antigen